MQPRTADNLAGHEASEGHKREITKQDGILIHRETILLHERHTN